MRDNRRGAEITMQSMLGIGTQALCTAHVDTL